MPCTTCNCKECLQVCEAREWSLQPQCIIGVIYTWFLNICHDTFHTMDTIEDYELLLNEILISSNLNFCPCIRKWAIPAFLTQCTPVILEWEKDRVHFIFPCEIGDTFMEMEWLKPFTCTQLARLYYALKHDLIRGKAVDTFEESRRCRQCHCHSFASPLQSTCLCSEFVSPQLITERINAVLTWDDDLLPPDQRPHLVTFMGSCPCRRRAVNQVLFQRAQWQPPPMSPISPDMPLGPLDISFLQRMESSSSIPTPPISDMTTTPLPDFNLLMHSELDTEYWKLLMDV